MWDTENPTFPEVWRRRKRLLVWDWLPSHRSGSGSPHREEFQWQVRPCQSWNRAFFSSLSFSSDIVSMGTRKHHTKSGYDFSGIGCFMNLTHSFQDFQKSSPSSSYSCCFLTRRRSLVILQRLVYEKQESAVTSLSFWCFSLRLWRSAKNEGQRGRSCHTETFKHNAGLKGLQRGRNYFFSFFHLCPCLNWVRNSAQKNEVTPVYLQGWGWWVTYGRDLLTVVIQVYGLLFNWYWLCFRRWQPWQDWENKISSSL